jgi:hypothetical protein
MSLNLSNEYSVYMRCEQHARFAAIGNEEYADGFHAELAAYLEIYARHILSEMPFLLPDFDPAGHESSDPKDNHGPDDIEGVNWLEIAEGYDLAEYV